MTRYNKRIDPVGDNGLTRTQQAVARRWGEVLEQLPRLADAMEKGDFDALADKGEHLAHLVDYLWRDARAADRAPLLDDDALFDAVDPDALDSPVGRALHPDHSPRD
ncbi:hypothetical protein [Streptomyces lunaelactis]|uniref:hypothetical protein n=1 Tax=Streptomyces lunaelactis TaxID=1535768 RepID=UPI001584D53C|nr:hypothetical protein [Streptomyces lunaelactis]NUK23500.1 hypothetical protein [Streptomyces lunaelactis]